MNLNNNQSNEFPDFNVPTGKWGNIAALDHGDSTQSPPEQSHSFTAKPVELFEPQEQEFNRLVAEELHPRDQQAILSLFPVIAVVQKKSAAAYFCRCQALKASKFY